MAPCAKISITVNTAEDLAWKLNDLADNDVWLTNALWQGWATRLDQTNLWYMLPVEYNLLVKITKMEPPYCEVTVGGELVLWFVGTTSEQADNADKKEKQNLPGQIWTDQYKDGLPKAIQTTLNHEELVMIEWAQMLYDQLQSPDCDKWHKAYDTVMQYWLEHREMARRIGRLLCQSMEDIHLGSTTLMKYAQAYTGYWNGAHDQKLKDQAFLFMHQPSWNDEGQIVNEQRLFCDLLAVHLIEDRDDKEKGWRIKHFVPKIYLKQFTKFHTEHGETDIYQVKKWENVEPPVFHRKMNFKKTSHEKT